jgi:uncharacterized protein (DUF3084 family)
MFKKIVNALVDVKPDAPKESVAQPSAPRPAYTPLATQLVPEDPEITASLANAFKAKASSDYDYLKFLDGQKALAAQIPDEITRFKATFSFASALGVTKQKLIDSAKFYLSVLAEEASHFGQGMDEQTKSKVDAADVAIQNRNTAIANKNTAIKNLMDEIAQITATKNAEIKTRNEEIAMMTAARAELVNNRNDWMAKIEGYKARFEQVRCRVAQEISDNINKLEKL